jgi:hypothetical protein
MKPQAAVDALALEPRDGAARRHRCSLLLGEGRHLGTAAARALVCCRPREHA